MKQQKGAEPVTPYFTIITPVFNQEKVLEKCIRSLQAQTDPDFEALIVDDGSTDGSVSLIRSLTEGDSRFRILSHERNRSVYEARRTGMQNAAGQYILFVDIDDYLEKSALETLRKTLDEKTFDVLSFQMIDDGNGRVISPAQTEDRLKALLTGETLSGLTHHAISGELVRRSLPFLQPGYCNMGEDYYISTVLLAQAGSIGVLEQTLYHYVTGEGMSTSTSHVSMEKLQRQLSHVRFALDHMKSFLLEQKPEYVQYLQKTKFVIFTGTLWQYAGKEVTWPMFFNFVNLFNNEEDMEVFNWACNELLVYRASYELKRRGHQI